MRRILVWASTAINWFEYEEMDDGVILVNLCMYVCLCKYKKFSLSSDNNVPMPTRP